MKKILITIHGAESFLHEEVYLDFLREQYIPRNIDIWEESAKTEWKREIAKKWSTNYGSVYMPTMPNKQSAIYRDWKMLFEELIKKISPEDEVTFIGNSLGGCFLLKYFSDMSMCHSEVRGICPEKNTENEQMLPNVSMTGKMFIIHQIHLVAACISEGDFIAPTNYEYLQKLENRVHIWHAEDDTVVPFAVGQELARTLPEAQIHFFSSEKGYGHFHGIERITELEDVIFS